jgi:formylmethanofuran dehydrogenase subunit C
MVLELQPKSAVDAERRIDASGLFVAIGAGGPLAELRAARILDGCRPVAAAELFDFSGGLNGDLPAVNCCGDWARIDGVGAGWSSGTLTVLSSAGRRAGWQMTGGTITIAGNAGDDVGQGMCGGRLVVGCNVGDRTGGPDAGRVAGMNRGAILVGGDAGRLTGWRMRRGTIAVAGSCGELAGYELRGGTLLVGKAAGELLGHDCRRGTFIVLGNRPATPGFRHAGNFAPAFVQLMLKQSGLPEGPWRSAPDGEWELHCGDVLHGGKGELWLPVPGDGSGGSGLFSSD